MLSIDPRVVRFRPQPFTVDLNGQRLLTRPAQVKEVLAQYERTHGPRIYTPDFCVDLTILMFGVPRLERLFASNEQLRTRASTRREFRPYDARNPQEFRDFAVCVNTYAQLFQKHGYPYLLRNKSVTYANQVWAMDITYVRMHKGWLYLCAVVDWYSRKVLAWRLSNTMDVQFCVDAVQEAIARWGTPAIFNTDQGSQFTSEAFTAQLKRHGIRISMDGKGAWRDNVFVERLWRSIKYEEIYLKAYDSVRAARCGIAQYLQFYNSQRPHQAHSHQCLQSAVLLLQAPDWEDFIVVCAMERHGIAAMRDHPCARFQAKYQHQPRHMVGH